MSLIRTFLASCLSLIFLLAGCSSDDATGTPTVARTCYMDSMTVTTSETYTSVYKYNAENQLTSVQLIDPTLTTHTTDYTYDQAGRLSSITGGQPTSYDYNQQNLRIQANESGYKQVFSYNGTNQLTKVEYYSYDNTATSFTLNSYDTFEYLSTTSRNPSIKSTHDALGNLTTATEMTYDNKVNPLTILFPSDNTYPTNNPTKLAVVTPANITQTYTYTYNEDGYPLTSTLVSSFGSIGATVTKYHYNCN